MRPWCNPNEPRSHPKPDGAFPRDARSGRGRCRWHSPNWPPGPTCLVPRRVCHPRSSDGWTCLSGELTRPSSFPHWVAQFNTIAVGHAQHGGLGQEIAGSMLLGPHPAIELSRVGQVGEKVAIGVPEPALGGPSAGVVDGLPHTDGDQLAEGEDGLAVVGSLGQGVVYLTEQFGDKTGPPEADSWGSSLLSVVDQQVAGTPWHFQPFLKLAPMVMYKVIGENRAKWSVETQRYMGTKEPRRRPRSPLSPNPPKG